MKDLVKMPRRARILVSMTRFITVLNTKLIRANKIFSFIYQNQLLAADLSKNGPQLVLFDTYSEMVRREDFNRHFRFAEHHR